VTHLVVFDLDGTLVDSRSVMEAAFRSAYRQTVGNAEPPLAEFFELLGDDFPNILNALSLPLSMWEPFRQASRERIGGLSVFDGIPDVLGWLRGERIACGLLTGKDRDRTLEILDRLALSSYFDAVVTSSDGLPAKPRPDGLLHLCRVLRSSPEATVMVGDSSHDMAAAREAGVMAIGCDWGIGRPASLLPAGCLAIASSPGELGQLLRSWYAGASIPR
jgi:3-amino-5-hydroxybenzoic acid synthesis related protein